MNVQISVHEYDTRDYDAGKARSLRFWTDLLLRGKNRRIYVHVNSLLVTN